MAWGESRAPSSSTVNSGVSVTIVSQAEES